MRPRTHARPRLRVTNASKTYGSRLVLDSVDLTIQPGEIHGLVGQNGSGKSTLAKILSGFHRPDPGCVVEVDGRELTQPLIPASLAQAGVSIVYQTLGLLDDSTVAENICITDFPRTGILRRIDWSRCVTEASLVLDKLGADIDPLARVSSLSPADRAKVAIGRALRRMPDGRGLIIFDESTRSLPNDSLGEFYTTLRRITAQGSSCMFIAHRLSEVIEHADRVTVLRDGRTIVAGMPTKALNEAELARLMLGDRLADLDRRQAPVQAEASIVVSGLVASRLPDTIDFAVRPGEILGMTGLPGSGFEELPYILVGERAARSGTLAVKGKKFDLRVGSVRPRIDAGVALIPERRDVDGLALERTIEENVTLPRVEGRGRPWWLGERWQREESAQAIAMMNIMPADALATVGRLSGGNQQKVLVAKWLLGDPDFLVLHEPTQAVDVKARFDILARVMRVAETGCAVLLCSTEVEDLAAICDRVLVFRQGSPPLALTGDDATVASILNATYGRTADSTEGTRP